MRLKILGLLIPLALLTLFARLVSAGYHFQINVQRMKPNSLCPEGKTGKRVVINSKEGHNCYTWKEHEVFNGFAYGVAGYSEWKAPKPVSRSHEINRPKHQI